MKTRHVVCAGCGERIFVGTRRAHRAWRSHLAEHMGVAFAVRWRSIEAARGVVALLTAVAR